MRRKLLLLCFTIAATAPFRGRAEAQLASCPAVKAVPHTCDLPQYGLTLAEARTAQGKEVAACCRQYISKAFSGAVAGKPHDTVAMADGSLASGVREPYTQAMSLQPDGSYFAAI